MRCSTRRDDVTPSAYAYNHTFSSSEGWYSIPPAALYDSSIQFADLPKNRGGLTACRSHTLLNRNGRRKNRNGSSATLFSRTLRNTRKMSVYTKCHLAFRRMILCINRRRT